MGHARALLGTPDRAFQELLAKRVVDEDLSVRAVEEAVREHQAEHEAAAPDDAEQRVRRLTGPPTAPPARSARARGAAR